jgi:hypothetical protein
MRLAAIFLAFCLSASAFKVDVTKLAAGTTILVNVLEIKSTVQKARTAAKAVKKTTVKVAKKVAGK